MGNDGCIYCMPCNASQVLKIDPKTQECTLIGDPVPEGGYKWHGMSCNISIVAFAGADESVGPSPPSLS